MFGLRHKPDGKFFRVSGNGQATADGDLKDHSLVLLPSIQEAHNICATQLKQYDMEIVELEIRQVRIIPPVIDVKEVKSAPKGTELSKFGDV